MTLKIFHIRYRNRLNWVQRTTSNRKNHLLPKTFIVALLNHSKNLRLPDSGLQFLHIAMLKFYIEVQKGGVKVQMSKKQYNVIAIKLLFIKFLLQRNGKNVFRHPADVCNTIARCQTSPSIFIAGMTTTNGCFHHCNMDGK